MRDTFRRTNTKERNCFHCTCGDATYPPNKYLSVTLRWQELLKFFTWLQMISMMNKVYWFSLMLFFLIHFKWLNISNFLGTPFFFQIRVQVTNWRGNLMVNFIASVSKNQNFVSCYIFPLYDPSMHLFLTLIFK